MDHAPDPAAANVVWREPSRDCHGSMPLGNGEVGINAWVTGEGELVFYIARTDAWSGSGRLLKLCRVRIRLRPNPFTAAAFRQELDLATATMSVAAGCGTERIAIRLFVDAHRPVVWCEIASGRPLAVTAGIEQWRTSDRTFPDHLRHGWFLPGAMPLTEEKDEREDAADRVRFWHRNRSSLWRDSLEHQDLAGWAARHEDPLLHRTCGGSLRGEGMAGCGDGIIGTVAPVLRTRIGVTTCTRIAPLLDDWKGELETAEAAAWRADPAALRAEHAAWWEAFWRRSWIRIAPRRGRERGLPAAPVAWTSIELGSGIPLADIRVRRHALSSADCNIRATENAAHVSPTADFILDPRGSGGCGGHAAVPGGAVHELPPRELVNGQSVECRFRSGAPAELLRLATDGRPMLRIALRGGRIHVTAGDAELSAAEALPDGGWHHLAVIERATAFERAVELYIDGRPAGRTGRRDLAGAAPAVSAGYARQRYLTACAGRGAFPIKFNGSLFTVEGTWAGADFDDPDFRQWGPPYWFQNTRLVYWPLLASGDLDLLQPFFRMWRDILPLCVHRTADYLGKPGAFFPETLYFWGAMDFYSYGTRRRTQRPWTPSNRYTGRYWQSSLELLAMQLERHRLAPDPRFLADAIIPHASESLRFYAAYYGRDADGRLRLEPSQSLETWHDAVDPTPDIAGLHACIEGLLDLGDAVPADLRQEWQALRSILPQIARAADGTILPARTFSDLKNVENPELYAVFPYRRFGLGKPGLEEARATFRRRRFTENAGWQQAPIVAACLGLADEAAQLVCERYLDRHVHSRYPGFFGPGYDWVPDQDHISVAQMALQSMVLQNDGDALLLLPAWPADWDVDFRLHAPGGRTVEGTWEDGRWTRPPAPAAVPGSDAT